MRSFSCTAVLIARPGAARRSRPPPQWEYQDVRQGHKLRFHGCDMMDSAARHLRTGTLVTHWRRGAVQGNFLRPHCPRITACAWISEAAYKTIGPNPRVHLELYSHVLPNLQAKPRRPLTRHVRPSSLFHANTKKN